MKNADIKKMLKNDVLWAAKNGHKIQMNTFGTTIDCETGLVDKYVQVSAKCGVCAIGSNLIRNQTKALSGMESNDFSRVIRRSECFTSGLVSGTDPEYSKSEALDEAGWFDNSSQKKAFMDGFNTGREVLDWVREQKKSGKIK